LVKLAEAADAGCMHLSISLPSQLPGEHRSSSLQLVALTACIPCSLQLSAATARFSQPLQVQLGYALQDIRRLSSGLGAAAARCAVPLSSRLEAFREELSQSGLQAAQLLWQ
jgi:hypothetical protein